MACMSDEARLSQRSIKAFSPSIRASCMPMDSEAGPLCLTSYIKTTEDSTQLSGNLSDSTLNQNIFPKCTYNMC